MSGTGLPDAAFDAPESPEDAPSLAGASGGVAAGAAWAGSGVASSEVVTVTSTAPQAASIGSRSPAARAAARVAFICVPPAGMVTARARGCQGWGVGVSGRQGQSG